MRGFDQLQQKRWDIEIKALRSIAFFWILITARPVLAYDEHWLIFQTIGSLSNTEQVNFDYVRRDFSYNHLQKNLELYRFSYGIQKKEWLFIMGGAYLDLSNGSTERRLLQMAARDFNFNSFIKGTLRLGLEERLFNSDSQLYFRLRARILIDFFAQSHFGPTIYNEFFLIPYGRNRFSTTLNENRLGMGFRYQWEVIQLLIFHTLSYQNNPQQTAHPDWFQLQVIYHF